jgi:hypothetical protein
MENLSQNKTARIAGFLYLLLIPLGVMGILYIPTNIIVVNDIGATIENLIKDEMCVRVAITSAFLVQLVNIFVVLFLYKLLKNVSKPLAVFMVISILLAIPIAFVNELNYFAVLHLLPNASENQNLISLFLNLHESGIFIAQIFWGIWLFPMGMLVYKSGFLPKTIGVLLMIGCFGYMIDSFVYFIIPNFDITFSEFTFIGEVALPLWLIFKGVKQ